VRSPGYDAGAPRSVHATEHRTAGSPDPSSHVTMSAERAILTLVAIVLIAFAIVTLVLPHHPP
jgi:hypothetical protein